MVNAAFSNEPVHDGQTRLTSEKEAALGFIDTPLHFGKIDLRPALRQVPHRKMLMRDLGLFQHGKRTALPGIVAPESHPEDADPVKESALPLAFIR